MRNFVGLDKVSFHILNHQQKFAHVNNLVMVSKVICYISAMNSPTETYFNETPTFNCYFVTTYKDGFSNIIRRTPSYFHTASAYAINSQVSRF